MKKVNKNNPLPLYYQLKEIINEMIDNNELNPGDLVPTERELCEYQNISRMTARKAIMTLVHEGVLYREQGKGTFVSEPKTFHQLYDLNKGFTGAMEKIGLQTSSKLLQFAIKDANMQVLNNLNLKEKNKKVLKIKRLRIVEDTPFAIETTYLPLYLCEDLTKAEIEEKSLYSILKEKYNYTVYNDKQTIEPIILNDYESELLNLENAPLALYIERTVYLKDSTPLEFTKSIYTSNKYKYEISFKLGDD